MKISISKPNATDVQNLRVGDIVRINEKTRYTVGGVSDNGARLIGARGGWANLVPSTCNRAVQLTTISSRYWIDNIEIMGDR